MILLWVLSFLPLAFASVFELTDGDFESKVAEKEFTLVMFYAPWCGHCKHLKPHFEEAAGLMVKSAENVRFAKLDCTAHGDRCSKFDVSGYPTLKLFKNGVFFKEYDGSRDTEGLRSFMVKYSQPPSKKISSVDEYKSLLSQDDTARLPLIIAYFKEEGSSLKTFLDVASDFLSHAVFAHTHDPKILESQKDSHIRLQRPRLLASKLEEQILEYTGKMNTNEISDWIRDNQFGLVGYRTRQNEKFFPKTSLLVLYNNASLDEYPKGVNYHRNRLLKALGSKTDLKLKVAYSFSTDYNHELSELGEYDGPFPLAVIYSKGKKYKLTNYSPEAVVKFVDEFAANKLVPFIKSQPVPEPSEDAAVTAVGSTFDEIINDETKDVFVMFHAPWCGHCKNLMPKFKEAAEKLRGESGVRFVLYDATANEIPEPYTIRGYPTLYFVPKKEKQNPKSFQGGREVDDLIKYVAKESTEELVGYTRSGEPKKSEL